jgi:uncharacterized protein YndB with AHSA1/START domain
MLTGTKGMLIRKPPAEVFRAFADPSVTTKFWYTRSSGRMEAGANLQWDWDMFGASASVIVKDVEPDRRIVFDWGRDDAMCTVELRFVPWKDATYVNVVETGYRGTAEEAALHAIDSIAGFALVLAAAKAWLEHGLHLTVVADHVVPGLEAVTHASAAIRLEGHRGDAAFAIRFAVLRGAERSSRSMRSRSSASSLACCCTVASSMLV